MPESRSRSRGRGPPTTSYPARSERRGEHRPHPPTPAGEHRTDRPARPSARGRDRHSGRHHAGRRRDRPGPARPAGARGRDRHSGGPMSVLLYGVTDAADPVDATGLDELPLRAVDHAGLVTLVSDVADAPPADLAHLWDFERVVERLMDGRTLLPARFGTTAVADSEIETLLADRQADLRTALEQVRGRVEYGVRATGASDGPSPTTGTAYLEARLGDARRLRELEDAARGLVCASRRTSHGSAYLVRREDGPDLAARAQALGLTVTGPWPAFNFVSP